MGKVSRVGLFFQPHFFAINSTFRRILDRFIAALPHTTMTLDAFDRQILDLYQRETRMPGEQIGAKVGLSAAAVQRRLKRMREKGVIVAETAELDCRALGLGLTAIVHVDLTDESARATQVFRDRVSKLDEVQQCYGVAGAVDYVLIVVVADLAAYDAFCNQCLLHDPNVRSFTTYIVLDAHKRHGPLAIQPSGDPYTQK
jgi:Lrp/AsnC family leucine-responsive transcriptional regulator